MKKYARPWFRQFKIVELQEQKLGNKMAPNSLNFCATDGSKDGSHTFPQPCHAATSQLVLVRVCGSKPEPGIVNEQATKGTHEETTIIASEPTTYHEKEWHLILLLMSLAQRRRYRSNERLNAKDLVYG